MNNKIHDGFGSFAGLNQTKRNFLEMSFHMRHTYLSKLDIRFAFTLHFDGHKIVTFQFPTDSFIIDKRCEGR